MSSVYIDFDSTLYDTAIIKTKMDYIIANGVCKRLNHCQKQIVLKEINEARLNGIRSVFGLCGFFEEKYSLEKNCLKSDFEEFLSHGEEMLYPDSIEFLKRLAQKGYEINILTYTSQDSYDYQMLKIMGANIFKFVDNIIICTKPKGELKLDYENGYFVDDNPKELISLFNAGVSPERLFRIKRVNAEYSNLTISEFQPQEFVGLNDIEI